MFYLKIKSSQDSFFKSGWYVTVLHNEGVTGASPHLKFSLKYDTKEDAEEDIKKAKAKGDILELFDDGITPKPKNKKDKHKNKKKGVSRKK